MATTVTVRPNSTISNSGWSTALSGGGTIHAAWADNSDLTAAETAVLPGTVCDAAVGLGTYALASDERCRRVRARGRIQQQSGIFSISLYKQADTSAAGVNSLYTTANAASPTTRSGSYVAYPSGDADQGWEQADIDDLVARVQGEFGQNPGLSSYCYEVYVDLEIIKRAVVAPGTAPSTERDPATSIPWTYTGNGEAQKKFQVRVFDFATTQLGGFDPAVNVPVYDSGEVTSSATSHTVPAGALDYGETYVAYIRAAKDFNGNDWWSVYSTGWQFDTAERPTVDVSAPPVDTNLPLISWSVGSLGSTALTKRQVKVFSEPGGGWGGFDPDVNAADLVEDSGELPGSGTTYQVASNLANTTTFRAYVKVWKASPDSGRPDIASAWDYEEWTTNFEVPPTPSIATAVASNGVDVEITVTPGVNTGEPDEDYYIIERRINGGPWTTFNLGGGLDTAEYVPGAEPFTIVDHEAPLYDLLEYRAFAVTTAIGIPVASPSSNIENETLVNATVWIKDIYDPSLNRHFYVADKWLTRSKVRPRTVHQPLNRSKPIVVRGVGDASRFGITFLILGDSTFEAIEAIIDSNRTMFVQTPKGSWYAELESDVNYEEHLWDRMRGEDDARHITLNFVEVDG